MSDRRNYKLIPPETREALVNYAQHGWALCGFHRAVISNDFMDAIAQATHEQIRAIEAIRQFVYQEMPGLCHGSLRVHQAWVNLHIARRDGTVELVNGAQECLENANAAAGLARMP